MLFHPQFIFRTENMIVKAVIRIRAGAVFKGLLDPDRYKEYGSGSWYFKNVKNVKKLPKIISWKIYIEMTVLPV